MEFEHSVFESKQHIQIPDTKRIVSPYLIKRQFNWLRGTSSSSTEQNWKSHSQQDKPRISRATTPALPFPPNHGARVLSIESVFQTSQDSSIRVWRRGWLLLADANIKLGASCSRACSGRYHCPLVGLDSHYHTS